MLIVTIYFFWFNCFCCALVIYDLFCFKSTGSESLIRPYLKYILFFFKKIPGLKFCAVMRLKRKPHYLFFYFFTHMWYPLDIDFVQ